MSVFSIIQAAGWPIWPLIIASIISMALVVERFISLKAARVAPKSLLDEALAASATRVPAPDVVSQLEQSSVFGGVLAAGLRALNSNPTLPQAELHNPLEGAGKQAAHTLERYLLALATIASAAPLMGLLGTVIGMIEIFGSQNAAGGSNPMALANGISIALYNTAFGLIVALPSLIFWRYFRARVDSYLLQMEIDTDRFERHLSRFCKK